MSIKLKETIKADGQSDKYVFEVPEVKTEMKEESLTSAEIDKKILDTTAQIKRIDAEKLKKETLLAQYQEMKTKI